MNWKELSAYQKLFILAVGIMIFYMIISRILGLFMEESDFPFRKVLRWIMGLCFVASAVWLYVLPHNRQS